MKKLLFMLLLAAVTLPGWAEDLYLVGNAVSIGWNINNAMRATKMTETGSSTNVYEWTGYFKASGEFKILTNKDSWDYGYNPTSATETLSDQNSGIQDRSGGDNKWKVASDGVYKITVNTSDKTIKAESATMTIPTLTDGYYQIGTANDLKNFADAINKGAIAPSVKAKLTANIDMTSITDFTPICCANAIKFTGEFDGQGHAITNLAVDYGTSFGYTGLFCYATDGAVIKNLIVGTGCSFKGTAKIGGIIGSAEGGGTVTLTNVINMANVTSTGSSDANAAGLVGCGQGGTKIVATNCANTGEIHGQDGQCAAFAGWTQSGTSFTNCWNIGDIYNMDNNQSLYRNPGDVNATNCYDANGADFYTQGTKIARTTVASGELCYMLNGDQTSINWYQNLTGTVDAYPVPFPSHSQVYANGEMNCAGNAVEGGTLTYSNSSSSTIPPHTYNDGWCDVCGAYEANAFSPVDGWYEISTAKQLRWMAESVNEYNSTYRAANYKLTADIDYSEYTSQEAMIGKPSNVFAGTFDGQNHTVTVGFNNTTAEETGLFRRINNGTVRNLKVDGTITTTQKLAGGICSGIWERGTIENCESAVTINDNGSGDATHGGILAAVRGTNDSYTINIQNCLFSGTLNASSRTGSAGIVGWTSNSNTLKVKNCLVTGTLTIADSGDNGVIVRSTCDGENNYYTCSAGTNLKKNYVTEVTEASGKIGSGELCYLLNGQVSGGTNWRQTIGTDDAPTPFNTSSVVYANGSFQCDGVTSTGDVTYANTENHTVADHSFGANNLCSVCKAVGQEPATSDGAYQIGSIGHLVWFASHVNAGNTTANGVLTADIAQGDAKYVPIGTEENLYVGHFDGQGHTVDLALNHPDKDYQGLFGVVTDGVFIEKVIVTGSVSGNNKVAGIVGGAKGGNSGQKTNIWYCGNEATITATGANGAGIIGVNMAAGASVIVTNCYNKGNITGNSESGAISGWLGDGKSSARNCYNIGTVNNPAKGFCRNGGAYFTNCYFTTSSGTDNTTEDTSHGQPAEVADADVASGALCAKLGFGFRQNLGTDAAPNFAFDHGFVAQISDAGYSTMYNIHSDVTIPSGIEAYAGVVNGENLSLVAITGAIAASEPVVLKGAAGLYNFMPTSGINKAANNDLKGSDGNVDGGANIYALAKLTPEGEKDPVVGFYPTGNYKIPEGKAYLKDNSSSVKGFTFVFDDEATSLSSISSPEGKECIYNLAGQRINKMQKGINIVNGKKIAVK